MEKAGHEAAGTTMLIRPAAFNMLFGATKVNIGGLLKG